jgi:two-component system LytT family response regulator
MQQSKVLPLHPLGISYPGNHSIPQQDLKICIHLVQTVEIVPLKSIMYIEADSNYCKVNLEDGKSIFHSKTLARYQEELENYGFLRVHQSYLINARRVVSIDKKQGIINLTNNVKVRFSNSRKSTVMQYFRPFSKIQ